MKKVFFGTLRQEGIMKDLEEKPNSRGMPGSAQGQEANKTGSDKVSDSYPGGTQERLPERSRETAQRAEKSDHKVLGACPISDAVWLDDLIQITATLQTSFSPSPYPFPQMLL